MHSLFSPDDLRKWITGKEGASPKKSRLDALLVLKWKQTTLENWMPTLTILVFWRTITTSIFGARIRHNRPVTNRCVFASMIFIVHRVFRISIHTQVLNCPSQVHYLLLATTSRRPLHTSNTPNGFLHTCYGLFWFWPFDWYSQWNPLGSRPIFGEPNEYRDVFCGERLDYCVQYQS